LFYGATKLETVRKIERLLYLAEYKRRQSAPGVKVTRKNSGATAAIPSSTPSAIPAPQPRRRMRRLRRRPSMERARGSRNNQNVLANPLSTCRSLMVRCLFRDADWTECPCTRQLQCPGVQTLSGSLLGFVAIAEDAVLANLFVIPVPSSRPCRFAGLLS